MLIAAALFNLASYCQGVAQSRAVQRCMPIESENVCLCGDFVEVKDTNRIQPAPNRGRAYYSPEVYNGKGHPVTYPSDEIYDPDETPPLKFKPKRK